MLQTIALVEFVICYFAWIAAFVSTKKKAAGQTESVAAPVSRWGIVVQMVGFAFTFIRLRPVGFFKSPESLVASMLLAPMAVLLAWAATRHLGKQWRFMAALSKDHELIRSGPYAWIRHPIYTSMFLMLVSAGFLLTWWPMFLAGVVFFVIGTEIRVRAEERLLGERFGQSFVDYRARTPAYVPFIR